VVAAILVFCGSVSSAPPQRKKSAELKRRCLSTNHAAYSRSRLASGLQPLLYSDCVQHFRPLPCSALSQVAGGGGTCWKSGNALRGAYLLATLLLGGGLAEVTASNSRLQALKQTLFATDEHGSTRIEGNRSYLRGRVSAAFMSFQRPQGLYSKGSANPSAALRVLRPHLRPPHSGMRSNKP